MTSQQDLVNLDHTSQYHTRVVTSGGATMRMVSTQVGYTSAKIQLGQRFHFTRISIPRILRFIDEAPHFILALHFALGVVVPREILARSCSVRGVAASHDSM